MCQSWLFGMNKQPCSKKSKPWSTGPYKSKNDMPTAKTIKNKKKLKKKHKKEKKRWFANDSRSWFSIRIIFHVTLAHSFGKNVVFCLFEAIRIIKIENSLIQFKQFFFQFFPHLKKNKHRFFICYFFGTSCSYKHRFVIASSTLQLNDPLHNFLDALYNSCPCTV